MNIFILKVAREELQNLIEKEREENRQQNGF